MTYESLEDAVFNARSLADPVEYLLQSQGDVNQLFDDRHGGKITLLHYMIVVKAKAGVEVMLSLGADPNLRASDGSTPLWTAMMTKEPDLEIIKVLVKSGADVNAQCALGDTALHTALVNGHKEVAQYLIEQHANPDIANDMGISARQVESYEQLREAARRAFSRR